MLRETRFSLWVGAATLAAVLAVGTIDADKAQAWSLEEAAAPYAGTEVRGICDGYAPCMAYVDLTAEFEEITGIKVNFDISDLAPSFPPSEATVRCQINDLTVAGSVKKFKPSERALSWDSSYGLLQPN